MRSSRCTVYVSRRRRLPQYRMAAPPESRTAMNAPAVTPKLSHNVTRVSHLDLPGAGQVYVQGDYAYVGHITNNQQLGTSILDVSDPKNPKLISQIMLEDP